jgi:hypothetical protein
VEVMGCCGGTCFTFVVGKSCFTGVPCIFCCCEVITTGILCSGDWAVLGSVKVIEGPGVGRLTDTCFDFSDPSATSEG